VVFFFAEATAAYAVQDKLFCGWTAFMTEVHGLAKADFREGLALVRLKFQAPSTKFQTNSKFQIPMTQTKALK
jgi:hypothetical protein